MGHSNLSQLLSSCPQLQYQLTGVELVLSLAMDMPRSQLTSLMVPAMKDKDQYTVPLLNGTVQQAWDHHPSWGFGDVMPTTTCTGSVWYKTEDMGAGFCTPNKEKDWSGCGMFHCNGDIYCKDC